MYNISIIINIFNSPLCPRRFEEDFVTEPLAVAFVCTHNACRSQIAEALARSLAPGVLDAHSAGTDPAGAVDPVAAQVLSKVEGVDTGVLRSKPLSELPAVDMVVTMGCGVSCPRLPAAFREDWGLPDPSGRGREVMEETVDEIRRRVLDLRCRALAGAFDRERLARNLKVLGDVRRLEILDMLGDGEEHCACELLGELDIAQPTLSHHMAVLADTGAVSVRREGRWMRYRLDRGVLRAVAALVGGIA